MEFASSWWFGTRLARIQLPSHPYGIFTSHPYGIHLYIYVPETARICPCLRFGAGADGSLYVAGAPKSSLLPDLRIRQILGAASSSQLLNPRDCQILRDAKSLGMPTPPGYQILETAKSLQLPHPCGCQILESLLKFKNLLKRFWTEFRILV